MRDGQETLDLVVRSEDGVALVLTAPVLTQSELVLVGALTDRALGPPVGTTIGVALSGELLEGAHIPREMRFDLVLNERDEFFEWQVETRDLGGGFRLQDARIQTELGPLRAFAIEDLATAVGIGLAVGGALALGWLSERRNERNRKDANRKWDDCIGRGGSPRMVADGRAEVGISPKSVNLKLGTRYEVECDMSKAPQ